MLLPKTSKFIKQNNRDFEKDNKDKWKALEKLHAKWKKRIKKKGYKFFFLLNRLNNKKNHS